MIFSLLLHGCLFNASIQKIPLASHTISDHVCQLSSDTRAQLKRNTLIRDPQLDITAQRYANVLKNHNFFAHNDPRWFAPKTPLDRVLASGGEYRTTGENLAKIPILQIPLRHNSVYIVDREKHLYTHSPNGNIIPFHTTRSGAEALIESWMNSPPHRETLLHHKMKFIGCGTAIQYQRGHIPMIISVQLLQTQ